MAPLVKSALGATPDFHHGLLGDTVANMARGLLVGVIATLIAVPAAAQQAAGGNALPPDRRTMTAVRLAANEQIALDGVLDEAAWQRAVPASDFTQQDPVLGGTPTERTEVRILFDGVHSGHMGYRSFRRHR